MKKHIFTTSLLALLSLFSLAQTKPIRIVFDVTSKDTLIHQAAIRHVTLESQAHPDAQLEVVIYSGALSMAVKGKSAVSSGVEQLTANKNISIMVCAETMKRLNVDKSQLLSGVKNVPDGILEIVGKQGEGWGDIKEAH